MQKGGKREIEDREIGDGGRWLPGIKFDPRILTASLCTRAGVHMQRVYAVDRDEESKHCVHIRSRVAVFRGGTGGDDAFASRCHGHEFRRVSSVQFLSAFLLFSFFPSRSFLSRYAGTPCRLPRTSGEQIDEINYGQQWNHRRPCFWVEGQQNSRDSSVPRNWIKSTKAN